MPSKREYDLVSDDGCDTRIPLHNEDAFQHGIHFKAKFVGSMDVPRPSSRVEIVAAMRRIRYEFKAKAIKKKKVNVIISVDGVRVNLRKKKKKISGQSSTSDKYNLMQHPIYRIFYVSHDSQDLKIWSYIARDGSTNIFKCNVFKANKKEQAMRIVRSIGQAFEVCHKLSIQHVQIPESASKQELDSAHSLDTEKRSAKSKEFDEREEKNRESMVESSSSSSARGRATPPNVLALRQAQQLLYQMGAAKSPTSAASNQIGGTTISSPISPSSLLDDAVPDTQMPLTSHHQLQLLRQQVEHHQQQTQVAIAQVQLLKDQLSAETSARIEAQARAHQLLLHNRDLLDHMSQLLSRIQELEIARQSVHSSSTSGSREITPKQSQHNGSNSLVVPSMPVLPDPTTPQCGPVYLPRLMAIDRDGSFLLSPDSMPVGSLKTFETDSPDSGHREMSAENLAQNLVSNNGAYWPVENPCDRTLYSYGFSSPVKLRSPYGYEMTATISSNPFAGGDAEFEVNNFEQRASPKWKGFDEKVKTITSSPPHDAGGNKLELKLNLTPKIKPPPEFRNSNSPRLSSSSDDSNDVENNSVKERTCNVNSDSDYYSTHTGSSTKTNGVHSLGEELCFHDNRGVKTMSKTIYHFKYHYNDLGTEDFSKQDFLDDEGDEEENSQPVARESHSYHGNREYSYSDEENTYEEEEDICLTKPPSPPPPPRRLEMALEDYDNYGQ
ncbi:hypothetical protein CHS0354_013631 [Potamilus streckersoni]|uniref:PID domain-containing protein n=1 Tax=Potamilus streckersoni TaxID=2493646 RepID=A0AAE0SL56_9BIVA|nr:hypothetical protein CHS0354_013631 [Potamilus streckersoni]